MQGPGANGFEEIDIGKWSRKAAYGFFSDYEDPFFNMTAVVDVTRLTELCTSERLSFAISCLYCSQKSANSIDEFRIRMFEGRLVRFDRVDATQTILLDDESFAFCYFPWQDDLRKFNADGRDAVERYKRLASFEVESDRVDLIYYSVIPWISFTSFKHASRFDRRQTVPRIVFGRKYEDSGKVKLPISIEVNHTIMDGIHVGKYVDALQKNLDSCRD